MHTLDLSSYPHPKEFLRNGVRTHVDSKGKSPVPEAQTHNTASCRTGSPTHSRLSYSGSWRQTTARDLNSRGLFAGCVTSQQHASVSQGQICSDNSPCCHTEIEVADQTFYLTQSQYTDTGPTSPSTDPIMPGAWQGSDECQFLSH